MKRTLIAIAAAALASSVAVVPAGAATSKAAWNLPLDHPTNVGAGAKVTSAPSLVCPGIGDCRDEKGHGDRQDRFILEEEEEES